MYIYFIQKKEGGPVKIGTSVNPEQRLVELQHSSPDILCIVAVARGAHAAEKRLHERFEHTRIHSEWFAPSGEMADLLSRLPSWEEFKAGAAVPRITSRRDTIRVLFETGYSLQDIGDHYQLTRQRIHQITRWNMKREMKHKKNKPSCSIAEYLEQHSSEFKDVLDGE